MLGLKKLLSVCFICVGLLVATSLNAQETTGEGISAPDFSVEFLTRAQAELANNESLSPEQITLAGEAYDTAKTALENAAEQLEQAAKFQHEIDTTPETIERLREEIENLEAKEIVTLENDTDFMTGETLLKLEQELISKEGELQSLRDEINSLEETSQSLLQRPIRNELSEARERLTDITADLETLEGDELELLINVRKISLEARRYFRRAQILAIEKDIAGQSARQQILALRQDLAALKSQFVEQEVIQLQSKTGLRRLNEALSVRSDIVESLSNVEDPHPFLEIYAAETVEMSQRLVTIANDIGQSPRRQAIARGQRDDVKSDLDIARELTELGSIDRQSSATLRRLRNQGVSLNAIRNDISDTRARYISATQDRLWAREQIRSYPLGQFNPEIITESWRVANPDAADLNATELTTLKRLRDSRRNLLLEISDAAFAQISEVDQLQTIQAELLQHSEDLRDISSQKLLWLPSVSAINLNWPAKIFRGVGEILEPSRLSRVSQVFFVQIRSQIWITILLAGLLIMSVYLKSELRDGIVERAGKVGFVQKDSYWHTPAVILACGLISVPIFIVLMWLGLLFLTSNSPDPFITSLGRTSLSLSAFVLFFMTWREWNRDKSLMDAHYEIPVTIRENITRNLDWFLPLAGVAVAVVWLTQNSREPDVYEGVSVLAFVIAALILSLFAYRILWDKKDAFRKALSETNILRRHQRLLTIIVIGLPIIAAIIAMAGYYDTARELLYRLFLSGGLFVITYVIYGLITRTVLLAQRRLSLRQALERREANLKIREEKTDAEEVGELPPPVNYREIDVETISRQSSQLLNTLIGLGFVIILWFFWRDLLPALSVFDEVKLWSQLVTDPDGATGREWVTLWNVMQAGAIAAIAFIAARNLPGFLEVFILNRSRLDEGTRYAIVTILGYAVIAIGMIAAFNKLGTEWSQLQWIVAALGVGIGFGLQEIIANFISGLIILFERPIRIGDYVTIGDQSGTVQRIKIRATTLSDLDNREIFIPNKELITQKVTNWTLTDTITRIIIPIGIAYGSDTEKAREIMQKVIFNNPKVLERPKSNVFFLGFGDSSLDFELRIFVRSVDDRFTVSHELHTEINKALSKAGINIPFPQRELRIMDDTRKS